MTKRQLFDRGKVHVHHWCAVNKVEQPEVLESEEPLLYHTCAFYRDNVIKINVKACAEVGTAGRSWSYPGYVVDRTPYGVLCHELGHHVDQAHGTVGGIFSKPMFLALTRGLEAGEPFYQRAIKEAKAVEPITGYHANVLEWFAEMFRLFVTNPDLLQQMRPQVYALMIERWGNRAEERSWQRALNMAPRQLQAAENKVKQAARLRSPHFWR